MELTMGTMVTMVLLVAVLILGGYLVNRIFTSGLESVDAIDSQVKNEINKLFAEDDSRKIIIYPASRRVGLEKGVDGNGFAFSIRNTGTDSSTFTYSIEATETDCPDSLSIAAANSLIGLGKTGSVTIPAGSIMDNPKLVTFNIPDTTPPCSISYSINIDKGGQAYISSVDVIVSIESN